MNICKIQCVSKYKTRKLYIGSGNLNIKIAKQDIFKRKLVTTNNHHVSKEGVQRLSLVGILGKFRETKKQQFP